MISQEYNANSVLQISITKRKSSPSEVDTIVPSFCSLYDSHGHQLDILPLPHYPGATNIVSSPEIVTKMQPLISKEATSASDVYELTLSSLPANCVAIYFTLHGNVPQPSDCDAAPTNLVHLCKVEVEARVISQRVADTPSPCSFVGEGFDSDISCVLMLRILRHMADGSWLLESKMSSMKDIPNHLYLQPVVEKLMLKDYCERSRRDMAARTLVYHLRKGESYPIPFGLTDLTVALGWDRTKLDIDVSALCLDASGAVVDLIYFGHLVGCGGSVRHGGDTRGSKTNAAEEILTIQTSKVPQSVRAILVTLSVFTMGKTLAHCSGEYARLFCTEDSQLGASSRVERLTDLARVVDVQNGGKNGLLFVALTRNGPFTHRPTGNSAWSFHALMESATGRKGEELKTACTAWYTRFTQLKVLTKSPRLAPPSKIIIIRGKHLKACDLDGLSDPYVKVYSLPSREKLYQTAVCAKTLNPVWNECVDIPRITQDILLTVKDKDMFNDDHIGEVVLKRCHFTPGEYTIALKHPADDSCGEITIRCIA